MIGAAANGIYAVSYKLPSLVNTVSVVFNQAWNYSAIRENESEDRDAYNNRVYNGVVAISVISGVGLMAIMKLFLKIYVARNYYEAWKYTPYLIVGYVFLNSLITRSCSLLSPSCTVERFLKKRVMTIRTTSNLPRQASQGAKPTPAPLFSCFAIL